MGKKRGVPCNGPAPKCRPSRELTRHNGKAHLAAPQQSCLGSLQQLVGGGHRLTTLAAAAAAAAVAATAASMHAAALTLAPFLSAAAGMPPLSPRCHTCCWARLGRCPICPYSSCCCRPSCRGLRRGRGWRFLHLLLALLLLLLALLLVLSTLVPLAADVHQRHRVLGFHDVLAGVLEHLAQVWGARQKQTTSFYFSISQASVSQAEKVETISGWAALGLLGLIREGISNSGQGCALCTGHCSG